MNTPTIKKNLLFLTVLPVALWLGLFIVPAFADAGPETNRLTVRVGTFYVKEGEKNEPLAGKAAHAVRKGKRIYVPVTVENAGREKSDVAILRYVETGSRRDPLREPRVYRIPALDPGKKWERVFNVRYEESGRKEIAVSLTTPEGNPLVDANGRRRPGTEQREGIHVQVKEF